MSEWLLGLLIPVVVQAWLIPVAIGVLPEPPADVLPPEGSAEETELHRVLRAEGPKERYAELARRPWLRALCVPASVILAALAVLRLGEHPVGWVVGLLGPTLVLLSVVDWRTRLLPRVVVLPATGVLVLLAALESAITRETHLLVRALVGMLVARSFFWLLWLVRRAGMGFGDVRLAALVGLVLARVSWSAWILGLYGGLLVFSLYGIGLAVVRRDMRTLRRHMPYGPFMVLGLYLGVLAGGALQIG